MAVPFALLAALVALPPLAQADEGDGSFASPDAPKVKWPSAHVDRPLTLPNNLFRLDFLVGGGLINRRNVAFDLAAGTGYGITDDFEIGGFIISALVSTADEQGLRNPSIYLRYRLLSGAFQVAGETRAAIPMFESEFAFFGAARMLLSMANRLRLDVRPEVGARQTPDWTGQWSVDGTLSVQLMAQWRLFAGARIAGELSSAAPLWQPTGGTVFTIGRTRATGDIEVSVRGPAHRVGENDPIPRDLSTDWFILVAYRPFIAGDFGRDDNPFSAPSRW